MIPIAYLKIDTSQELTFEEFIDEMESTNHGIDMLFDKPVVSKRSDNFKMDSGFTDEINSHGFRLSQVVLSSLKENGFSGKFVLAFVVSVEHWEIHIDCMAFPEKE